MGPEESQSSSNNEEENIQNNKVNSTNADSQESQITDLNTKTKDFSQNKPNKISDTEMENHSEMQFLQENRIDKDLYNKILENLDIKTKEQNIQEKLVQEKNNRNIYNINQQENLQIEKQIKQSIRQDLSKIQNLVQIGLINSTQGQNLKKQVLRKAFDKLVQTEKIKRNFTAEHSEQRNTSVQNDSNNVFDEFSKSNPNFFSSAGRKEVLNYLKSNDAFIGGDELNKISKMIRLIEKSAIEGYLRNMSYEKNLKEANETAKQKLTANAQKSMGSKNLSRTFTREQIGKMSRTEFTKYESEIMAQLKKGLIK